MLQLIYTYCILWICIYVLVNVGNILRRNKVDKSPVLPQRRSFSDGEQAIHSVTLRYFGYFKYETSYLVTRIDQFAQARSVRVMSLWFDIGIVTGGILLIASVILVSIAAWTTIANFLKLILHPASISLHKRDISTIHPSEAQSTSTSQIIIPAIPGVTLPLDHLPYFVIALAACAIVHEAGHAIAACVEKVSVRSVGIMLMGFFPGAFVNIDDMTNVSPRSRLRIICAGVWHNAISAFVCFLIISSAILPFLLRIGGYEDLRSQGGVAVISILGNSPLSTHLPISSIVTRLDDHELSDSMDTWTAILTSERHDSTFQRMGYCIDPIETELPTDCCQIGSTSEDVCFRTVNSKQTFARYKMACLPPEAVLVEPHQPRCITHCNDPILLCMEPAAHVLRIYWKPPSYVPIPDTQEEESVVLYFGERQTVLDTVRVGVLAPTSRFHPIWLPDVLSTTLQYVFSFSLAFAILNSLPVLNLDGTEALTAFLDLLMKPAQSTDDIELGRDTSIKPSRLPKRRIERVINGISTSAVIVILAGSLLSLVTG